MLQKAQCWSFLTHRDGVPVWRLGWDAGFGRLLGLQCAGEPVGLHLQRHRERGDQTLTSVFWLFLTRKEKSLSVHVRHTCKHVSCVTEWSECSLMPQDVHRLTAATDLHAGPLPGLQCQEQQVAEERFLPLWHRRQHLDATKRGYVGRRRAKVGVWPPGSCKGKTISYTPLSLHIQHPLSRPFTVLPL